MLEVGAIEGDWTHIKFEVNRLNRTRDFIFFKPNFFCKFLKYQ